MSQPQWNDRYATGDLPWDTGEPDPHLVELVEMGRFRPGRALEIGCGTGTNVIWLARQGFEVTGIDLSPLAIEQAEAKRAQAGIACELAAVDFLTDAEPTGPFDFVFDRGCFHVFDHREEQSRFAERVAELLAPTGKWLSLIGSTEGPERDHGPPRRTLRDIANAIEPFLEVVELRGTEFHADIPTSAKAWLCISRPREVPAQPSTVRED